MHDAMALLFQAGEKAWEKIAANPDIDAKDVQILKDCYVLGRGLEPDDPGVIIKVEQKLDLGFLDLDGGKPDLFYLSPKFKTAVLIDWKFGAGAVEDPDQNLQMRAYGPGIANQFQALDIQAVEPVIIQPGAWKKDDWVRAHAWSREELRGMVPQIRGFVARAKSPDAPTIAGPSQCRFCKAKEVCETYKGFAAGQLEIKEAALQTAVNTVKNGTAVIVSPEQPFPSPVVVIDEETIAKAEDKKKLALSMRVVDDGTANAAGLLSKDVRALRNLINVNREAVKKPFWDMGKLIDAAAKKAMDPLDEAAKFLDDGVQAFRQAELAKQRAAQEAEEKKRREAEAAQQRAAEEEEKAKAAAAEAERLQLEAVNKAAAAKSPAAKAKAQAAAEEAYKKAEAARNQAEEAAKKKAVEEQKVRDAEAAKVAASQPMGKTAGYRDKVETTYDIPDFSKIPKAFLQTILVPNEKVILMMIQTGALNEEKHGAWLTIIKTDTVARSR